MFDADTVALIQATPALDGLDPSTLPQRLTDAYANIVSARMRLRQSATGTRPLPDVTAQTILEMRRLAYTLEALVSVLPERRDRSSAAFVAGTAHHVTLLAENLRASARPSVLAPGGISPEVSAVLLFLIAEATADAAEMAKSIGIQTQDPVEAALLEAVRHLANGRLAQLLDAAPPAPDIFLRTDRPRQGARSLYFMLLHGVRGMAAIMLGRAPERATAPYAADPQVIFAEVKALSIEEFGQVSPGSAVSGTSLFPGPLHMASLLSAVARDLTPNSLARLPPPADIDPARWFRTMGDVAQRKPFLWRNHRQAIQAGYLERGVSSVISFPTGSGKSLLAELKIAACLLRKERVVFLAPTLALVDQTATALSRAFPSARVQRERTADTVPLETEELPAISVLTPEHCLMLLSFAPGSFADVGLLVFDECHLLHPRDPANSRRAVDAMLCVLHFAAAAPTADLLFLSAMVMNATEIADWLCSLTGRKSIPLELTWKPTRQARGCVVYGADEIERLRSLLVQTRGTTGAKHAPIALRRQLVARPFGFFCLRQTWSTAERDDYALLPLLDDPVALATGTARDHSWYLTPNGNKVAGSIGAATAAHGLKTLVFTPTIPFAHSAVTELSDRLGVAAVSLTTEEELLLTAALEEVGDATHLYLGIGPGHVVTSLAAPHHGLLLPVERHLHESLFRRANGLNVLVATSTLAQGMNLPSEVVIIAGDSRFDPDADRLQQIEAHELLNAAGRAGRAGESSYGFVIVVPSKVVDFNNATNQIHRHWTELRAIFARSDQCLAIEDPLVPLLDEIQAASGPLSSMARYLIRRLPAGALQGVESGDGPARTLLSRSFGAHSARSRSDANWVTSRVEAALAARRADPEATATLTWADQLAAAAGVSAGVINELGAWLRERPTSQQPSVQDWCNAMFVWLDQRPSLIPLFVHHEGLEGLFGKAYAQLTDDSARGRHALPMLKQLSSDWMRGGTLAALERAFGTAPAKLGKCETARQFALRVVPDLAYVFGLPSQVVRALASEPDPPKCGSLTLDTLAACVREGFDEPAKLALKTVRGARVSRVAIHREFAQVRALLGSAPAQEDFRGLVRRVRSALAAIERPDDY